MGGFDFTTDSYEHLRADVRDFATKHVRPRVPHMEHSRAVDHELARLIAARGWIGATIDPEYGGMGAGHLAKTIIIEELSRVSGAAGATVQASQLGVAKIIHFGTPEQKRAWLPSISAGDCLPTIAVTEADSGGHVLGMTTTAQRDGDDYILNGHKIYIGNSHVGDLHGVVARTGPGSHGLTAFLVEVHRPGLSVLPQRPAMGLHGFAFGELEFNNCRIPATARLGAEGDGLAVAYSSSLLYGRPNLAAVSLGIHRALVEATVAFVTDQRRYGRPLAELPTIKQRLGQMESRLMTARTTLYHSVSLLDRGLPCDPELINAKLVNAESALDSARDALAVHAACGLHTDRPIERFLRDAHHIIAPAGTSDIQRLRLAEFALGTSHEQWSVRFATPLTAAQTTPPTSDIKVA